ncbi:restriction endonuclease subunit S [Rhizobium rhizogenes]
MSPTYPRYRPSGLSWLGSLPEHWSVRRLSGAFELFGSGTTPKSDDSSYYDNGNIAWVNTGDLNDGDLFDCGKRVTEEALTQYPTLRLFPVGSVVIAMYGATIGKLSLLHFAATVNQACCVFGGRSVFEPRFLFFTLMGLREHIISLASGGGQPNISQDVLRNLRIPLPPPSEQNAIAAFLDRETTKIDALVEEQNRLIDLLKGKRQAVISQAVTRGLNPNATRKATGIEWLGEVPEHWELCPVRAMFRFVKRQNRDELDVLSVYREYGVILKASRDDNINKTPEDLSFYQTVLPGDLVVNKMKAWQGSVGVSKLRGITSPDYAVFAPTHTGHHDYFNWLLRCGLLPGVYRSISNGIRPDQWRLEPDRFKELKMPIPPLQEQLEIDRHLQKVTGQLDQLSEAAETAIVLLNERRSALISAAVTGKIDVRGLADVGNAA